MNKKVSIVIPCYNEEKYISQCINSILSQKYENKEIIVCDGGSQDGTLEIIKSYGNKIILLENKKRTTPHALNLGIKNSSGDIVIIFGAHAVMKPDYVYESVRTFDIDKEIACVGGVLTNINESNIAKNISAAMSSIFGVGNAHFRTGLKRGYVDTVAFGAYKKDIFDTVGYFDEELTRNQDDEFNYRITNMGYKIYLNPTIKSDYYVRATYKKLFKQYYQYGYWKVYVNKKHRAITTIRQLFPALLILFIIIGLITTWIFPVLLPFYIIPVLIYIWLGILFAALKSDKDIVNFMRVLYSFWILHFSYGLGYINGIIDFLILNKSRVSEKYSESSR